MPRPLPRSELVKVSSGLLRAMETRVTAVSTIFWYDQDRNNDGFKRAGPGATQIMPPVSGSAAGAKTTSLSSNPPAKPAGMYYEQREKGKGFQKVRVGGEEGEAKKKESLARIRSKSEALKQQQLEKAIEAASRKMSTNQPHDIISSYPTALLLIRCRNGSLKRVRFISS